MMYSVGKNLKVGEQTIKIPIEVNSKSGDLMSMCRYKIINLMDVNIQYDVL